MPVEIPKLNRFDVQAPDSAGRMEVELGNPLAATAPLREGVNKGLGTVVDALQERTVARRKNELAVKGLKATEYGIKYEQALKSNLDNIKQLKGDVTPVYKQFDEGMLKLEDDMYTQIGEDPETRFMLKEKIIKANGRITDIRSTNQTQQYYAWQKEVGDSSVKLRQDNANRDSALLNATNPLSFGKVQKSLYEIEGTRANIARQNGYNIPIKSTRDVIDPLTGEKYLVNEYDYTNAPAIEAQIKADIGDTIIPMVKTLNNKGKVNEAKAMIEGQKNWLNAKDYATLTADNDEASVKNRALDELSKLGPDPSISQINSMKDIGEDVKLKMREINHTNTLHLQRENKEKADASFLKMMDEIENNKKTKNRYVSPEDYRNRSTLYQNNKNLLTAEQRKSLDNYFDDNRETDPSTMIDVYDMYRKGNLSALSGAQVWEIRGKLSGPDSRTFETLYRAQTQPTSEAGKNVLTRTAIDRATMSVSRLEYSDGSPMFKKKSNGKYSKADDADIADVLKKAQDYVTDNSRWTQEGENEIIVKETQRIQLERQKARDNSWGNQISGFVKGFWGSDTPKKSNNPFNGGSPTPAPTQTPTQPGQTETPDSDMSTWDNPKWVDDYYVRNGNKLPPAKEMSAVLKQWKQKRQSGEIK